MASWFLSARRGGLLALALLLAVLPLLFPNNFYYDVATKTALNAIVCIGLNLLIGYAGQISLGHAGFFALGAYASAILTSHYKWPGLLAMLAGALMVALLAFIVARPILRLKGHYLAMATLGLGIIIAIVINREIPMTGGPDGMNVPALWVGPWRLTGAVTWYWVSAGALLLAVWLSLNLVESPIGRALRALHGSEVAAETTGVDTTRYKVLVFVVSAVFASIAGSLFAHADRFVTPVEAGFLRSIEFVTMVVLGGMASTFGSVVGAAILTVLPQVLAAAHDYKHMALGVIMIGVMIFMPRGLVPTLAAFWRRRGSS
ncbi:MAG TPA: branched-chain amino acid ABC transporter permease [Alphaproteobacteria bacterium]|nr:branched-chain amino acid ABC transporter permease [Alphaproteobacteria bacterium]